MDEQALIAAIRAGDRSLFASLVERYEQRLFNGVMQVLRHDLDAEDVVQEAFILAYTKLNTFQGNSSFYTWLFRIARNLAITKLRSRRHTMSLDAPTTDTHERPLSLAVIDGGAAPDEQMRRQEDVAQLHQALHSLSDEHREILVLRELQEMDYDAIAEILEIPVGTVRSRLHRARMQLREELERLMDSPARENR